jgi:hypothetical protein
MEMYRKDKKHLLSEKERLPQVEVKVAEKTESFPEGPPQRVWRTSGSYSPVWLLISILLVLGPELVIFIAQRPNLIYLDNSSVMYLIK